MKLADVIRLLPRNKPPLLLPPQKVAPKLGSSLSMNLLAYYLTLPGKHYHVRWPVYNEQATCDLLFAVDHKLSRIACRYEEQEDRRKHMILVSRLHKILEGLYGPPSQAPAHINAPDCRSFGEKCGKSMVWEKPESRLELRFRYPEGWGIKSAIELDLQSRQHMEWMTQWKEQATQKRAAALSEQKSP
jgi:hypothetical protein